MKKRMLIPITGVLMLVIVSGCSGMLSGNQDFINEFNIETPDFSTLPDGIYKGQYENGVLVRLGVTLSNRAISRIDIYEHDTIFGKKAEDIVDTVVARQSLDVDVVAGATLSSLCILKAVQIALE